MRGFTAAALILFGLASADCSKADDMTARGPVLPNLPLPRDGDVAVREELDAARRAGTLEAYDLFIARHPDHPLADEARRERARLRKRRTD